MLQDEDLAANAQRQGEVFRSAISGFNSPIIRNVRGKGLLNAVVIDDNSDDQSTAMNICLKMADLGLLAKPTHGNIIRFAPPLTINDSEMEEALGILKESIV